MSMGLLDRFKIRAPSLNLSGASESIEEAMERLEVSTNRLEGLLARMNMLDNEGEGQHDNT